MSGSDQRLKLIQRAAQRLASSGKEEPPPPALADMSTLDIIDHQLNPVTGSAGKAETRHANGTAAPLAGAPAREPVTPRSFAIDFARLRAAGMITPDTLSSLLAHEFRSIKRSVLATARKGSNGDLAHNLVIVTSAMPFEGKTFTAINLALILAAQKDLNVLLVDCDVARPGIARVFGIDASPGLMDLLQDRSLDPGALMIRCTNLSNLAIIPAGSPTTQSPELMGSRRMAEMADEFASRYPDRIVIFDTPPVLGHADAAALAGRAHQAILVIEAERTERSAIDAAVENLGACPNIGLVLNKAPTAQHAGYAYAYN